MQTYTVKQGDTLGAISLRYYGFFAKWTKIRDANPQLVGRKSAVDGSPLIFPGDVLVIPTDENSEIKSLPKEKIALDKDAPQDISILINGKAFTGFSGYSIEMSVDSFDTFSFSAPFDESSAELKKVFEPFSYCDCAVYYDGEIVFNGTLLTPNPEVSADKRMITLQGYPRCGVINDVCLSEAKYPPEFSGMKLSEIVKSCISPFGFGVEFQGDEGSAFDKVEYSIGETLFSFFKKLAEQRGLIITNKPNGDLLFWSPKVESVSDTIHEGKMPFLSCRSNFDSLKFFSHITGFSKTTEYEDASSFTFENKYLTKKGVFRPFSFVAEDAKSSDLENAVISKAGRMFASAVTYSLEVVGHKTQKGELWRKNMCIAVLSEGAMINRETKFCVDKVHISRSDSDGNKTSLSLVCEGTRSGEMPTKFAWE